MIKKLGLLEDNIWMTPVYMYYTLNMKLYYNVPYKIYNWFVLEIDHCLNNNCQNGAECIDDVGKYICRCPAGYQGDLCNEGEYIKLILLREVIWEYGKCLNFKR